jgi:hypothetical protein
MCPLFRWLLPKLNVIPVNQEGIDRAARSRALIRVLKSGNAALVFQKVRGRLTATCSLLRPEWDS